MDEDNVIQVWTDGSSYAGRADRPGGWAFYGRCDSLTTVTRYGWSAPTTVNVMELTAIIRALQFYSEAPYPIVIYSDSQYSRDCIQKWPNHWARNGWKTLDGERKVANKHLIILAMVLMGRRRYDRKAVIRWVRGHSGAIENERVDAAAKAAWKQKRSNWDYVGVNGHLLPIEVT